MIRLLPRLAVSAALVSIFALNAINATAGTVSAGMNLSWTDCGATGTADKTGACVSNTGAQALFVSFFPPAGEDSVEAMAAILDITSMSGLIPPWWNMETGGCRAGKISVSANFTGGPFSCTDFWNGQALGGLTYEAPFDSVNRQTSATALNVNHAWVRLVEAVQEALKGPVTPGTEYYLASLNIVNALTTTCSGCSTPMCIVLNQVNLSEPAPAPDAVITTPPLGGRNIVTWQGAGANCAAVPVKNKTWGQVKSLYR
jgi:hypothetical protein